jgi:hypothetical protein
MKASICLTELTAFLLSYAVDNRDPFVRETLP